MIRVYGRCQDCGASIPGTGRSRPLRCDRHKARARADCDARHMRRKRGREDWRPIVPTPHLTPLAAELVRETVRRGVRTADVAADFGVHITTVRRHLKRPIPLAKSGG